MNLQRQLEYAAEAYRTELAKKEIDYDSLNERELQDGICWFLRRNHLNEAYHLFQNLCQDAGVLYYYQYPRDDYSDKQLRECLDARLFLLEILIEEIKQDNQNKKK